MRYFLKRCLFFMFLILFFMPMIIHSQETGKRPVIYVQDFENRGQGYDIFGEVMKYSIKGILGLTDNYRIITEDTFDDYLEEVGASELKGQLKKKEDYLKYKGDLLITEVLRGTYMPILEGRMVLWEIQVFKLADGQDSFAQAYQSTTDADIFDVIDGIGQDMSGILTGKVLETARVDVSTIVPGSQIFIDGIPAGKDQIQFNRAIAGLPHKVEIRSADNEVLFEKTIVPVKGMIYDISYNYKEYQKLVQKEIRVPDTNVVFSTNLIDLTNQVQLYTTNEMEVVSTNWIEETVTKEVQVEKVRLSNYKKWGWGIFGGGGIMAGMTGHFQFRGLKMELQLGVVPQFLGYTADTYLSAQLNMSLYPLGAEAMISPYVKLGVMTYYGLQYGIIPTIVNDYEAFGVTLHFKKLPGIFGKMRFHIEVGGMGSSIIPDFNNGSIPHEVFEKMTLGLGVSF